MIVLTARSSTTGPGAAPSWQSICCYKNHQRSPSLAFLGILGIVTI